MDKTKILIISLLMQVTTRKNTSQIKIHPPESIKTGWMELALLFSVVLEILKLR
jgi:hypothetical protein